MNIADYKLTFNYHTHTWRNGHGNQEAKDEEYVKAAIEQGIKVLGFSEHCPYQGENVQKRVRMDYEQIEEYCNSIRKLKEKYEGQCDILTGFECEYYPSKHDEYQALAKISDYLILGQHFRTFGKDFMPPYCTKCDDELAKEYTNYILQGLDTGLFAYLAHPDYFVGGTKELTTTFIECIKTICQKCEELNIPMEFNLRGSSKDPYKQAYINNGEHFSYPNRLFWNIAKNYRIKCVIGIDAHDPIFIKNVNSNLKRFACEFDGLGIEIIEKPFLKHRL